MENLKNEDRNFDKNSESSGDEEQEVKVFTDLLDLIGQLENESRDKA